MSAPVWAVIATAAIGLLTGCGTLEPDYDRPAAPTPAAFPTGPAYPAPPGPDQPGADPVQAAKIAWKAFFTDEKLRAVISTALANNRDMRVAVANIEAAQAQYRVQRSDLFPTVNASTGASYGRDYVGATPGLPSGGGASAYETSHEFTTSVGFTAYEIDLFGRIRSLAHGALEQYLATEEARRAEQISLIAEVATDYMTLSSDIASLSQYKDNLVSSRESLEVTRGRFNFGAADELDVAQADTVVQQARASVASATTTVATDLNALNLVVGAPHRSNHGDGDIACRTRFERPAIPTGRAGGRAYAEIGERGDRRGAGRVFPRDLADRLGRHHQRRVRAIVQGRLCRVELRAQHLGPDLRRRRQPGKPGL